MALKKCRMSFPRGIVAWMVKTALDVIPAKAGIQAFFVMLNLFQHLFSRS
ncbi:hypothetical protein [Rickettsia endosymbiont of Orchestes rusci]